MNDSISLLVRGSTFTLPSGRRGRRGPSRIIIIHRDDLRLGPVARALVLYHRLAPNGSPIVRVRSIRNEGELMRDGLYAAQSVGVPTETAIAMRQQTYGDVLAHQKRDWPIGIAQRDASIPFDEAAARRLNEVAHTLQRHQLEIVPARATP